MSAGGDYYPAGTGQPVAPMNAPAAVPLGLGVQPGTPSIIRARVVIVFGANEGLFVYSGTPALGNPPIFWATAASADPYGNPIVSTAGVTGTGIFTAGDTVINEHGIFVYSN